MSLILPRPALGYHLGGYDCTLVRVVDGDTLWVRVDLGLRVEVGVELRLIGIDTPELVGETRAAGLAAKEALEGLLYGRELRVTTVLDAKLRQKADGWKRWLAHLWADGFHVNQWLVEQGHAIPWRP